MNNIKIGSLCKEIFFEKYISKKRKNEHFIIIGKITYNFLDFVKVFGPDGKFYLLLKDEIEMINE